MTVTRILGASLLVGLLGATACSANSAQSASADAGSLEWLEVPVHPAPVPEIEESQATVKPRLLKPGKISYPIVLASEGIEGKVRLRYIVMEDGTAAPASMLVLTSTHPAFNAAAKETMQKARFAPGQRDGYRVRVWVESTVSFTRGDS